MSESTTLKLEGLPPNKIIERWVFPADYALEVFEGDPDKLSRVIFEKFNLQSGDVLIVKIFDEKHFESLSQVFKTVNFGEYVSSKGATGIILTPEFTSIFEQGEITLTSQEVQILRQRLTLLLELLPESKDL